MRRGQVLAAAVERADHVPAAAFGGRLKTVYDGYDLFDTGQAVQQPISNHDIVAIGSKRDGTSVAEFPANCVRVSPCGARIVQRALRNLHRTHPRAVPGEKGRIFSLAATRVQNFQSAHGPQLDQFFDQAAGLSSPEARTGRVAVIVSTIHR